MQPTLLSEEISNGLKSFITTGFETDTPYFKGLFSRFVEGQGNLLKGPWVSMGLPFQTGEQGTGFFSSFETTYPPYVHQQQAWERITSDRLARSTLVATGTGSGKTECFLYPLLDHCGRHREKGIKAIVIYPMNALATDQAKRFAEEVAHAPSLKGVRVGLFVGGKEEQPVREMQASSVITDKNILRETPPDILLTNYKMLDFLLLRPKDRPLWRFNGPETLRYLVVDELHTFDGAQGTDLACLIRRLRGRVADSDHPLICVGTSATLGSGRGAVALTEYASQVFHAAFDEHAVVVEQRQGVETFLQDPIQYLLVESEDLVERLDATCWPSLEAWLDQLFTLFFVGIEPLDWKSKQAGVHLGSLLKRHLLFNNILKLLSRSPLIELEALSEALRGTLPHAFQPHAAAVLNALVALVALAKDEHGLPLVNLRLQLWMREMRRMVVPLKRVEDDEILLPRLMYADDLKQGNEELALPLVQCNHCNTTAWITRLAPGESNINVDLRAVYQAWFSQDPESVMLLPLLKGEEQPESRGMVRYLCRECGHLQGADERCSACGQDSLQRVFRPELLKQKKGKVNRVVSEHNCPVCAASHSMIVFGARSVTLSSVAIHHLYASRWNDDKKLITFSDSVQDASHRAGFFAGRTWRNLVRGAMAQAMVEERMALDEYYQWLPNFWRDMTINPNAWSDLEFVTHFIGPNMLWYEEYLALQKEGATELPADSRLVSDVSKRLEWEVLAEFGYRSAIGRSLEQVGLLVLGVERAAVERAVEALMVSLHENEGLRWIEKAQVSHFVLGLLLHMKQLGAIDHRFLQSYIQQGGRNWLFNQQSYLPSMAPNASAPVFLTDARSHSKFETLTSGSRDSWLVAWMKKTLGQEMLPVGVERTLIPLVMDQLVQQQLLVAHDGQKGSRVWALNSQQLYLSRRVAMLETASAKDRRFVDEALVDLLEGMPSLLHGDQGCYEARQPRENWLAKAYQQGELARIFSGEHTGLLERDLRQQIEHDFIHGDHPWSCNLLSATPTLEMGIDIGDLSSLLLCSVPPAQANYLQRIGRAGRRDGNAFAMTVAEGAPHDLYFYADPLMMMAGDVEPPGVYLNAFAVISRQLTAYCMDQWVDSGIDERAIPKGVKGVLDALERGDHALFPFNFLDFVEAEGIGLFDAFVALFGDELTEASQLRLKQFVLDEGEEEGIRQRLITTLHGLQQEREGLVRKIKALKNALDRLKRKPEDEAVIKEMREVEQERGGLMVLLQQINGKQPLNFMTDEGLIPNYAFPEQGVTLRSVIYRKRGQPKEGEPPYENEIYEYERPGVSAIRELIPNSKFYAGERRVQIRQVDLDLSSIEQWRFCPSCAHAAISQVHVDGDCPKCGDPMWSDGGQLIEMARLRQVMANSSDRDSRISDESEDRESSFHVRQMMADVKREQVVQAFRIAEDALPFGFEFVRKVAFREVNFGEYGATGDELEIAGVAAVRPGFLLCRHCGMVQNRHKVAAGEAQEHSHTCRSGRERPSDEKNLVDCLYLYREFSSEALRILMPLSTLEEGEGSLNSFIAGLQLGLQLRFGGKVDHLRVMNYSEPAEGGGERHFLMIYDSVPGGTGYLQQLMEQPEQMMEIFRLAHDHMSRCSCNQDLEKDGCYRCLYAYRNSHGMESTSRDRAVELFGAILDHADRIEPLETVDEIVVNPLLDSELERQFIAAFRVVSIDGLEVKIHQQLVGDRPGWFLQVGERLYTIEPQVDLGKSDRVELPSRPDFVIRSARTDGQNPFLPIALFLDGYQYHNKISAEDSAKRMAILCSGEFRVWSLTWDDVRDQFAGTRQELGNPFSHDLNDVMLQIVEPMSKRLQVSDSFFKMSLKSSFEQLLHFLADPVPKQWQSLAFVRSLYWFDRTNMVAEEWVNEVRGRLSQQMPVSMVAKADLDQPSACAESDFGSLHIDLMVPQAAIQQASSDALIVSARLDDKGQEEGVEKRSWHGWLSAANLFQFLPHFIWSSSSGVESGVYEAITLDRRGSFISVDEGEDGEQFVSSEAWRDACGLVDSELKESLCELEKSGLSVPVVGYEIDNDQGEVVAEAELAWPDQKIICLYAEESEQLSSESLPEWTRVLLEEEWESEVKSLFNVSN